MMSWIDDAIASAYRMTKSAPPDRRVCPTCAVEKPTAKFADGLICKTCRAVLDRRKRRRRAAYRRFMRMNPDYYKVKDL